MKPDIRWQSLLALVGLALALMLLSYQVQSAALCTAVVPAAGGTFVEGMVGRPASLNPLLNDAYPVDRDLTGLIFDGLVSVEADAKRLGGGRSLGKQSSSVSNGATPLTGPGRVVALSL